DSYEKSIIDELQRLSASVTPFDVELQGFGSFGHTLFVNVKSADPILELTTKRRQALRPFLRNGKAYTPYFVTKPHITIARNLTPSQTVTIWTIWRRTRYRDTFQARGMTLLKRKAGTLGYTTVKKFTFLAMAPQFTQGKLFA